MTDSNDDHRKGRPPGRSDRSRTSGDRPARPSHKGGDRPFRPRGDDNPWEGRKGPSKPFRSRDNDDRPRRPREHDGDKPFRARRDDGDRPFRGRGGDDRPRRPAPAREDSRSRQAPPETVAAEPTEERIAKVIARAGVASRRDAEAMIAEGRVTLNGKVLESPAINVTAADTITVDGEPLPVKERTRLWLYHKPRGLVTTARDPEGRPTVFENLPEDLPRVVAVGRLDINTEGLLLLTNDGGLAKVIAHPDTGWLRRYKVRAHGDVTQADLDKLRDGVTVDEMEYGPVEARLDRVQGDNVWLTLGLREGKNREVKRILEHLGLQVNRLIRLSFGPFQLGEIESGLVEEVRTKVLRDQLGAALAAEAGVDFESPVREPIAAFGKPAKERAERSERHDERPARFGRDRDEERPRRGRDDDERPSRARGGFSRQDREDEEPRKRPSRLEPKKSIWRADDTDEGTHRKAPRRGADPKAARAASAERPRQRVGAISSGEGRKVVVERLIGETREETSDKHPGGRPARRDEDSPRRQGGPAPRGRDGGFARPPRRDDEERPRRPAGDRPFRSRSEDGERPRRPRPEGDRPFKPRREEGDRLFKPRREEGDRPFRGRGDDDRPRRGPPRGDGPPRGPSKGRPGGGFKGGAKGGPRGGGFKGGGSKGGGFKGGPRGRRP
ncbi:pseudouridine synthase [Microvirga rosea]|uniref:pseudouridine synthase n=1 Tax=Microvirga rosea TaxID=2715425 RepID=UPI001D0B72C5|nr:pseudouridine synthase [Microvirga rosea]MCB8820423.1 pseudouridine synthase [Microvirga rosea]